jgi:stage IV sporulation protein A
MVANQNQLITQIIDRVKESSKSVYKMRDLYEILGDFNDMDNFDGITIDEISLGKGSAEFTINPNPSLYYKVL